MEYYCDPTLLIPISFISLSNFSSDLRSVNFCQIDMNQKRPQPGQNLPGYTGHTSAQVYEAREASNIEEMTMRQKMDNERMRNKVPGYQGYVPQVKSENVFGTTFGKSTLAQKEG